MLTHLPTIYLDSDRSVCYFITEELFVNSDQNLPRRVNERHWRTLYNFREIEFIYPNKAECYKDVNVFHAFKDTNTDLVVFTINDPNCYDIRCRLLIDLAFKSIITEGNDQFSFEIKDGLGYLRLV